ncbi:unnamed protein product, partial [Larinioides sclopetarius]
MLLQFLRERIRHILFSCRFCTNFSRREVNTITKHGGKEEGSLFSAILSQRGPVGGVAIRSLKI